MIKHITTKKTAIMTAVMTAMLTVPVYANEFGAYAGNNGQMSGGGVVSGFAKFFATIGTYGGALYLIGSVFSLILAIRNEDTEGRNKAILNMLAAIGLISIGGILNFFGITQTN